VQAPNTTVRAAAGVSTTANSAEENELITELASPVVKQPPTALPNWTSVLLGPLYRGTEVTVK
jgi:phospholipid/cholesterol/gamma-HCH transport system substrate-binding protein